LPYSLCCDNVLRTHSMGKGWYRELKQAIEIAPSILAADFARLAQEIEKVERAGADVLHLDVMDGHFVPNLTIGPPVVSSIRKITRLPLDVHLMVQNPEQLLDAFIQAGANWISVHIEADANLDRTIHFIQEKGLRGGVAINPATSLTSLDEILPLADYVLIMTVNPGFGGQEFIPSTLKKIRRLKDSIVSNNYKTRIEVDGGIGSENLDSILTAGADIIVAGSAVFSSHKGAFKAVREMKRIAEQHNRAG
jgi:ribulose-phosphate 3-epimerase